VNRRGLREQSEASEPLPGHCQPGAHPKASTRRIEPDQAHSLPPILMIVAGGRSSASRKALTRLWMSNAAKEPFRRPRGAFERRSGWCRARPVQHPTPDLAPPRSLPRVAARPPGASPSGGVPWLAIRLKGAHPALDCLRSNGSRLVGFDSRKDRIDGLGRNGWNGGVRAAPTIMFIIDLLLIAAPLE
jgi:hypothetical protein